MHLFDELLKFSFSLSFVALLWKRNLPSHSGNDALLTLKHPSMPFKPVWKV